MKCPKCSGDFSKGALRVEVSIDSLDAEIGASSSARAVVCAGCAGAMLAPVVELAQIAGRMAAEERGGK